MVTSYKLLLNIEGH